MSTMRPTETPQQVQTQPQPQIHPQVVVAPSPASVPQGMPLPAPLAWLKNWGNLGTAGVLAGICWMLINAGIEQSKEDRRVFRSELQRLYERLDDTADIATTNREFLNRNKIVIETNQEILKTNQKLIMETNTSLRDVAHALRDNVRDPRKPPS